MEYKQCTVWVSGRQTWARFNRKKTDRVDFLAVEDLDI